eukprot:gene12838-7188_t
MKSVISHPEISEKNSNITSGNLEKLTSNELQLPLSVCDNIEEIYEKQKKFNFCNSGAKTVIHKLKQLDDIIENRETDLQNFGNTAIFANDNEKIDKLMKDVNNVKSRLNHLLYSISGVSKALSSVKCLFVEGKTDEILFSVLQNLVISHYSKVKKKFPSEHVDKFIES